jgi:hypothetical protein
MLLFNGIRGPILWAVIVAALVFTARPADAAFMLRLTPSSSTLAPGQSVDVTVQLVTDGSDPLYGFTAKLNLDNSAPAGLSFTAAQMPGSNYVFQGNSFGYTATTFDVSGNPLGGSFPAAQVTISDTANDLSNPQFAAGTYDLGVLTLTAAPGTQAGTAGIKFDRIITELDGPLIPGNDSPIIYVYNSNDGQITVEGPSMATPAPPSAILFALGILTFGTIRSCRRIGRCGRDTWRKGPVAGEVGRGAGASGGDPC